MRCSARKLLRRPPSDFFSGRGTPHCVVMSTPSGGLLHCVTLTWTPGVTPSAIEALTAGLAELKQNLSLRDYTFGVDLDLVPGNADFAIVARFPTEREWRAYLQHPEHVRLIEEKVQPIIAARAALQIRLT